MSKVVFDIETYRPNWQVRSLSRREDFDPEKNHIVTAGFFDGNDLSVFPVIDDLRKEGNVVEYIASKLEKSRGSELVGYNILRFDIPYIVHKAAVLGHNIDLTGYRILDLYWILPYWFRNVPEGRRFYELQGDSRNLWSFDDVVKHILKLSPNPFSNFDVLQLWEMKSFKDIEQHLTRDLTDTLGLFEHSSIRDSLLSIQSRDDLDRTNCKHSCPYIRLLQRTPRKAVSYCALLQDALSREEDSEAIDTISQDLPRRDTVWKPNCLSDTHD